MQVTLNTWIVSDTHFKHQNIVRLANRPVNHDALMEKNWRNVVAVPDPVLHLGDVGIWYNKTAMAEAEEIVSSLPGDKYLIMGNHDEKLGREYFEKQGFTILDPFTQVIEGRRIRFTHAPETEDWDWDINIHGHIHINGYPGNADPTRDYRNVSIESTDFTPVRLSDIIYKHKYTSFAQIGFDTHDLRKRRY